MVKFLLKAHFICLLNLLTRNKYYVTIYTLCSCQAIHTPTIVPVCICSTCIRLLKTLFSHFGNIIWMTMIIWWSVDVELCLDDDEH